MLRPRWRLGSKLDDALGRTYRRDSATAALSGVYSGVLGPFLGLVAAKTLHASPAMLSLMMVAPFVGNLVTPLWTHHLHGRPKLPFVTIPWLVARSSFLLVACAQTVREFAFLVFFTQICESSSGPAYSAVMERIYPAAQRGRLMSSVRVSRTIVAIGVTLTAGNLIDRWGYHGVFVAAGLSGVAAALVFNTIHVLPGADELGGGEDAASAGEAWRIFRRDTEYRRFSTSLFVYGMGNLLLLPIYPLFLAHTLHVSYGQQGVLAFVYMLALGIGFAGWGHVVDRYGPVKCVYACIAVVGFRPLIYAAAGSYGWLFPAAILGGLSDSGIEIGYLNSILSFSPPTLIPSYQSLHATLLGIRGVLSMFLAGAMCTALQAHHLGYRPAFILSTIMIFSGLWLGRKVNTR